MQEKKLGELLNIKYPIIQGGMVWCSGWKLASSVSNNGGLGVIGAGSMTPELLFEHILKTKKNTKETYAVNVPLFSKYTEEHIKTIIENKVPVVITSAGNPHHYTQTLQKADITVLHVVAGSKFAQKAINANVDGIIAEGFEAGGHNGRDETTTMCLIPQLRSMTNKPLIAAGGIGNGASMYAAMSLGADGVQIGSRFAIAIESSAHDLFKDAVRAAKDGDTRLTLKELAPVRLLKNNFFDQIMTAYSNNADHDSLVALLAKGRSKLGIFEGDLHNGELEIGQVSAYLKDIESTKDIMISLVNEFSKTQKRMQNYL